MIEDARVTGKTLAALDRAAASVLLHPRHRPRRMAGMAGTTPLDRILIHLPASRRLVVEPDDVYVLEADGDDTIVRQRGKRTIRDVRRLPEVMAVLERHHFHRIHDNWAVNLRRVREIRPQRDGHGSEVVMEPPVNRVLPVSRRRLAGLLRRLEP